VRPKCKRQWPPAIKRDRWQLEGPAKEEKYYTHRIDLGQFGAEVINFLREVAQITCNSCFHRLSSCLSVGMK